MDRTPWTRIGAALGLTLGLVAPACGGGGGGDEDGATDAQTQAGPGPGGPGTSEGPEPTEGPGEETDTGEGPPAVVDVPLRRLTRFEYRNTVQDLFAGMSVPEVELPLDDKREGFDNNAAALIPTKLHIDQYNSAAEAIADAASQNIGALIDCTPDSDPNCSRRFVAEFGARAFRRPLTAEEEQQFHAFFEAPPGDADFAAGVEVTLQLMLQSPQFLYRIEVHDAGAGAPGGLAPLEPYQVASRLSYFLWSSMPDADLIAAAAAGQLGTPAQIEAQARRMLDDPRAERAFLHFFRQWSDMEKIDLVTKLAEDNLDESTRSAMREEFERFVREILFYGEGSFGDLLKSNKSFLNDRLAELYGVAGPGPDMWAEVELDPAQRAGLFTQTAFLAGHGHPLNPSPVKRGNYMLQNLLCTSVGSPPPIAEAMGTPQPTPGMTNREVYDQLTGGKDCIGCHSILNPVGFAFEHYDTMGRFRAEDQGKPVDASGSFGEMTYADAVEFMQDLSEDINVQSCFTRKWLVYGLGGTQLLPDMLTETADAFAAAEFNLRELQVAIATHPRFSSFRVAE